ncbi:LysR family transcriptional regulator [Caldimonas sp. KR1-144]|uniref:LysR family transcriptional regulator n=1 Tax=Caldimonas sp. KR1-144 TaxID=3400911 RepID=UPI003BFDF14C
MGRPVDWNDIRIFLAIARARTLGGAARAIGQSQPTMGRRLRVLEGQLGHALFQRGPEGLVLTDEGTTLLVHAERMEAEALALDRVLGGQDTQLEGTLRVSSSDWFGSHMLTPVFAEFSKTHPGVSIELVTDARLFNLARREADLVFRIRAFDEAGVIQRKLMHIGYGLYRPKGLRAPRLGDGAGCALIALDSAFSEFPDARWLKKLLPRAHVAFSSNSREVQARMCAAGVGLAVLPRPLGDSVKGIERIDCDPPPPGRDVWIGYHRDLRQLRRLRALLDLTIERLGGEPAAQP